MNELTRRINKRIKLATGLNIDHGEELQVANYGLGGYYAPHYDYSRVPAYYLCSSSFHAHIFVPIS